MASNAMVFLLWPLGFFHAHLQPYCAEDRFSVSAFDEQKAGIASLGFIPKLGPHTRIVVRTLKEALARVENLASNTNENVCISDSAKYDKNFLAEYLIIKLYNQKWVPVTLRIAKLGRAVLSRGATEKARGFHAAELGGAEIMVADIGPQPRGGQHIENSYSRFDALRKAHDRRQSRLSDIRRSDQRHHQLGSE